VANGLILETTFLVDLERELAAGHEGPAQAFLAAQRAEPLFLTFTVAGELAVGLGAGDRRRWEEFIGPFAVLPASADVCWEYGRLFRYLKTNGLLIGANDLWIAATALAFGKALVTRNRRDFQRVPGLEVMGY
jgi:predicted nucleic acid-binding protein